MKVRVTFLYLIFVFNLLDAQRDPQVLFPLYFENVLGDRDTVELGWDSSGTLLLDTLLGERDVTSEPMSDFLEVRVATFNSQKDHTKRGVGRMDSDLCETGKINYDNTVLLVSRAFPVYMYWDREYFQFDSCLLFSRFTAERSIAIGGLRHHRFFSRLLAERGYYEMNKSWFTPALINYQVTTESGRTDTVWHFFVGIASQPDSIVSSVTDLSEIGVSVVNTADGTRVKNMKDRSVALIGYSILGQELLRFNLGPGEEKHLDNANRGVMVLKVTEGGSLLGLAKVFH